MNCECGDKGCPAHAGKSTCDNRASRNLVRVDMDDRTGTNVCDPCADDMLESGLFAESVKNWINATRKR